MFLNTYRPPVSMQRAAELLRAPEPAFVCVNRPETLYRKGFAMMLPGIH